MDKAIIEGLFGANEHGGYVKEVKREHFRQGLLQAASRESPKPTTGSDNFRCPNPHLGNKSRKDSSGRVDIP
jgi:hypothetical protein